MRRQDCKRPWLPHRRQEHRYILFGNQTVGQQWGHAVKFSLGIVDGHLGGIVGIAAADVAGCD